MVSGDSGNVDKHREDLLDMLDRHPPRTWPAELLAAVAAVVRVQFPPDQVSDTVSSGPCLRIL